MACSFRSLNGCLLSSLSKGRRLSSVSKPGRKYVLGCGSNVVDNIYNVRVVPQAGEKGFFMSPFKAREAQLIGGVTLNHLAWAALGGVPAGLLAFQGNDEGGNFIRSRLKRMGVTTEFIEVKDNYITSECHVFIQEDGERSILQAPAASFLINTQSARAAFESAIKNNASMVTTEISQLPFTGVLEILKMAKEAGVVSILDLDVPPKAAIEEAKLGVMEDMLECLRLADIIKPAKAAADEVLKVMGRESSSGGLVDAAVNLMEECNSKMVAITDGASGSIFATKNNVIKVKSMPVDKVIDTTGAGDAFLGGLIVGLSSYGFPGSVAELERLGGIANAFGAAGVQSVGGVPVPSSKKLLQHYLPDMTFGVEFGSDEALKGFTSSLERDAAATQQLLSSDFDRKSLNDVLTILEDCQGQIFTSGIGKSGLIASRLAASLSSIGVSSQYVNAVEWRHGDLGKLTPGRDVCIFISHSGSTDETVEAAASVLAKGVTTISIAGKQGSSLGKLCTHSVDYSHIDINEEPFGCLPTTSLAIQDILVNAIVSELILRKGVTEKDFGGNHPGGTIGSRLGK
ncbi:PREDICTED: probable fructokinase-5 [Amphimedon queenslandica]|uniref:SIS domain-containing protein n=1 Tax=Amphimedon queenslandica TaxID=400682 RepID=A0A1X7TK30_AMPQE|nr:PREDICTED: probable fructokinase-5 [Amphimedon queenslandica]|eukprot:XP_019859150.1 PREDICTED: probable fructokinase-5 [Amphimedon queenslandica]